VDQLSPVNDQSEHLPSGIEADKELSRAGCHQIRGCGNCWVAVYPDLLTDPFGRTLKPRTQVSECLVVPRWSFGGGAIFDHVRRAVSGNSEDFGYDGRRENFSGVFERFLREQ
jgi:hypothetical protein